MNDFTIAIIGIFFIFFMTSLGSSIIFISKHKQGHFTKNIFLSFAGGVMLSASIFSLIIPSFNYSMMINIHKVIPVIGGIIVGALFILIFDIIISQKKQKEYHHKKLFLAMTLHNIPEGLSVGLTFGLALNNYQDMTIISSLIFAIGIGIQNLPEGAALTLPLYESNHNKVKSFLLSSLSGSVEPLFAILGLLLSKYMLFILPWALCFGAGAMIYVIVDELIISPNSSQEKRLLNIFFIIGFLIMTILDLCL